MKFSAFMWFMSLWLLFVSCPIAHWVWGGGWLRRAVGALDYAGGTVVHLNAGTAGLVACLMLGKRVGLGTETSAPHNLLFSVIGASLLWSAGSASMPVRRSPPTSTPAWRAAGTQIATAVAALGWMFAESIMETEASSVLRASFPARWQVLWRSRRLLRVSSTLSARSIIGVSAGVVCYVASVWVKKALGYDDALDT